MVAQDAPRPREVGAGPAERAGTVGERRGRRQARREGGVLAEMPVDGRDLSDGTAPSEILEPISRPSGECAFISLSPACRGPFLPREIRGDAI